MPTNEQEKVEDFRLSKEMKQWVKLFRRFEEVTKGLESKMSLQFSDLEESRKLYDEAQKKKMDLLKLAPLGTEKELPGQEGEK